MRVLQPDLAHVFLRGPLLLLGLPLQLLLGLLLLHWVTVLVNQGKSDQVAPIRDRSRSRCRHWHFVQLLDSAIVRLGLLLQRCLVGLLLQRSLVRLYPGCCCPTPGAAAARLLLQQITRALGGFREAQSMEWVATERSVQGHP